MKNLRTLFLVGLALLGGVLSANAQSWLTPYAGGTDASAVKIKVDSGGNTIVLGTRTTGGQVDILLLKYDTSGANVWSTVYAGTAGGADIPADMVLDSSDNIYVVGTSFRGATGNDIVTIKYNSSGVFQWVKPFNGSGNGNDSPVGVRVDSSGNVYVVGTISRTNNDIVVVKYFSSSSAVGVAIYNGTANQGDGALAMTMDSSENILVAGYTYRGAVNDLDYITLKYDSTTGIFQWVQAYNGSGSSTDYAVGIATDSSGNVVTTGYSYNGSDYDYVTIKYNSAGVTQWAERYNNGVGDDSPALVTTAADGTIYVTGFSLGVTTGNDWATIKYSSSGVVQWVKRTRTGGDDIPNTLFVDSSYNVYVGGYVVGDTSGGTAGQDAYTVKYNAAGTATFSKRYNGTSNNDDSVASLCVAGGSIYVVITSSTGTRNNIVTLRYP